MTSFMTIIYLEISYAEALFKQLHGRFLSSRHAALFENAWLFVGPYRDGMSFDHEWDVPDAEGLVVCVAVGVHLKSHKVRAERVFEVRLGQVLGLRVFEVWDLGVIGDPGEVPEHGRKVPVQILVQRPVREAGLVTSSILFC